MANFVLRLPIHVKLFLRQLSTAGLNIVHHNKKKDPRRYLGCLLAPAMAAFGLNLDSPLIPNVDAYINPTKDEDAHRSALNAVVSGCHLLVFTSVSYSEYIISMFAVQHEQSSSSTTRSTTTVVV